MYDTYLNNVQVKLISTSSEAKKKHTTQYDIFIYFFIL